MDFNAISLEFRDCWANVVDAKLENDDVADAWYVYDEIPSAFGKLDRLLSQKTFPVPDGFRLALLTENEHEMFVKSFTRDEMLEAGIKVKEFMDVNDFACADVIGSGLDTAIDKFFPKI